MSGRETYIFRHDKVKVLKDLDTLDIFPEFKNRLLINLGKYFKLKYFVYSITPLFTNTIEKEKLKNINSEYLEKVNCKEVDKDNRKKSIKIVRLIIGLNKLEKKYSDSQLNFKEYRRDKNEMYLDFIKSFENIEDQYCAINGILNTLMGYKIKDFILINEVKSYFLTLRNYEEIKKNVYQSKLKTNTTKPAQNKTQTIKWQGTQTQFIELVKSLIENGNIKGKQKHIINSLSETLNIEIKNPDIKIQNIKNRINGSETLFLDELKSSLYAYIVLEKEKKQT